MFLFTTACAATKDENYDDKGSKYYMQNHRFLLVFWKRRGVMKSYIMIWSIKFTMHLNILVMRLLSMSVFSLLRGILKRCLIFHLNSFWMQYRAIINSLFVIFCLFCQIHYFVFHPLINMNFFYVILVIFIIFFWLSWPNFFLQNNVFHWVEKACYLWMFFKRRKIFSN